MLTKTFLYLLYLLQLQMQIIRMRCAVPNANETPYLTYANAGNDYIRSRMKTYYDPKKKYEKAIAIVARKPQKGAKLVCCICLGMWAHFTMITPHKQEEPPFEALL